MKIMAIDYGLKRIGLATTDSSGTISQPFMVIKNRGPKKNVAMLGFVIRQEGVEKIVIGLPLYRDGNESPMCEQVREFGELLREKTNLEIIYVDERHTSSDAEEHIRENLGITNPTKIREMVDKMAASMILSNYINGRN